MRVDVHMELLPYLVGWGFLSFIWLGLALWTVIEIESIINKQLEG